MNSTLKFQFVGTKFGYFHHPLRDSSKIKKYAFCNRCCGDHHIIMSIDLNADAPVLIVFSHKLVSN